MNGTLGVSENLIEIYDILIYFLFFLNGVLVLSPSLILPDIYLFMFLYICLRSLKSWDMRSINVGFANGAEIDLKIDENFKESDMVTFLKNYADQNGIGGNILSSKLLPIGLVRSDIHFLVGKVSACDKLSTTLLHEFAIFASYKSRIQQSFSF